MAHRVGRVEGEFELARPHLDLHRAHRQIDGLCCPAQIVHDRFKRIVSRFDEQLIALREVPRLNRLARHGRLRVRERGIGQFKDVEFDL